MTRGAGSESSALVDFESLLPVKLLRVGELFEEFARRLTADQSGLRFTEVRIIAYLARRDDASTTEISRDLFIDKAWISRLLRGLADKGLVRKLSSHRTARIAATAAGRSFYERMLDAILPYDSAIKAGIAEQAMQAHLDQLEENLRNVARTIESGGASPA